MTRGEMQYYLKVIRKGYRALSGITALSNAVMLLLLVLPVFLLLVYEPADAWHDTSFTLSHFEYRYNRGGAVLDLYTTDDRRYVLNHNEREIGEQLTEGQQYQAVYSDDLFHDTIKGLADAQRAYINTDEMRAAHRAERVWFVALLIFSVSALILTNGLYIKCCIRGEKRKMRHHARRSRRR